MIRFGVAGKQGSWRSMAPRNCYKLKMDLQKIKYDTIFQPKNVEYLQGRNFNKILKWQVQQIGCGLYGWVDRWLVPTPNVNDDITNYTKHLDAVSWWQIINI